MAVPKKITNTTNALVVTNHSPLSKNSMLITEQIKIVISLTQLINIHLNTVLTPIVIHGGPMAMNLNTPII